MNQTPQSRQEWDEFRALESKRHKEFFLQQYPNMGMKVVEDIFDDTKTNDYDVIVEIEGKRYSIDEKARNQDYGDLLVEVMQCLRSGKIGWLYKHIDYIFYASWKDANLTDPSSAYIVKMPNLRDFVIENYEELPEVFSSKGYGLTFNKRVNWQDLVFHRIATKVI